MLHPQPTRQNNTVNSWAAATMKFTQNALNLDWKLSLTVNLGLPTHRHNIPLEKVPVKRRDSKPTRKNTSILMFAERINIDETDLVVECSLQSQLYLRVKPVRRKGLKDEKMVALGDFFRFHTHFKTRILFEH